MGIEALAVPLMGILNRCRGGLVHTGRTQLSRVVFWGVPFGALLWWQVGAPVVWLPLFALLAWAGTTIDMGRFLDVGHNQGDKLQETIEMTFRGVLWVGPLVFLVYYFDVMMALKLMLAGLTMGICYRLGYLTPSKIKGFHRGPELGELYFGMILGAVVL